MLTRFAAATAVASIVLAIATAISMAIPCVTLRQFAPVLALWCIAPFVWGVWAMIAPAKLVPRRLPIWGALLGALAGVVAMIVLNLPLRIFAIALPIATRALGIVVAALVYYLLWKIVSAVYRRVSGLSAA